MDGMRFPVFFHVPGTLAANVTFNFKAPCDLKLNSVSAVGTNAHDATIIVGTSADSDGYMTAKDVGDSSVPNQYTRSSFTGALMAESGQPAIIAKDTVVVCVVDFDGAAGTSVQNLTVFLDFTEG